MMADPVITNIDNSNVIFKAPQFDMNATITFAGADTFASGTILAVDSVSLKYVLFVKGGVTNENGIPKGVLTYDVVATGAGDEKGQVLIAGSVRKEKLIIDADGDDSNVDKAVLDELRDYSIIPEFVTDVSELDNQ